MDAARYLTERTGQSGQVSFQAASALGLPFCDELGCAPLGESIKCGCFLLNYLEYLLEEGPSLGTLLAQGQRAILEDQLNIPLMKNSCNEKRK